jgi:hypothetical protein
MTAEVLQLLRDQHQDVMSGLAEIKAAQASHEKEDKAVHKMVERHTMYFNIAFLGLPLLAGTIAKKIGFIQ